MQELTKQMFDTKNIHKLENVGLFRYLFMRVCVPQVMVVNKNKELKLRKNQGGLISTPVISLSGCFLGPWDR